MSSFEALAGRFYFDKFDIETQEGRIRYFFSTDKGHAFVHELTLQFPVGVDSTALTPAVFALGLAELAHYWKAILAPQIVVKAGKLDSTQIAFWQNLYTKGLGEFFYTNQIDFHDLVHIESSIDAPQISAISTPLASAALVPLGGGKDSLVTGELLKKQGKAFTWFELEPLSFTAKLREASANPASIAIGRNVQKNFAPVLKLVAEGAPNGHVPITATYMFSAALAALLNDISDVVLSLERSAEEGNVEYLGLNINHQYSKTFEFERQASAYIQQYINSHLRVFSLLRPLYELQITHEFVNYPQYFPLFISCNRGLKNESWCGECAKCAFTFAALAAFLPIDIVTTIFHKNLFEDTGLIPLYQELTGHGVQKPFDCVGTFEENRLALYLAGEHYRQGGTPLPAVLAQLPIGEGKKYEFMLAERGPHSIPIGYSAP